MIIVWLLFLVPHRSSEMLPDEPNMQVFANIKNTVKYKSLFEMPNEDWHLGMGDFSPLWKIMMEKEWKNLQKLESSREMLVNINKFTRQFVTQRDSPVWNYIMKVCQNDLSRPEFIENAWKLLWHSIQMKNVTTNWNMWNPFYETGIPETPSSIIWPPKHFESGEIVKSNHVLIVFNLMLCETGLLKHPVTCPDQCLGKWQSEATVKQIGNPCEEEKNLKSTKCSQTENWPSFIQRFWTGLADTTKVFGSSIENGDFAWMVLRRGFACECNRGFGWYSVDLVCKQGYGRKQNVCNPITLSPCVLPGAKSCQTDDITGNPKCTCHSQYIGTFCQSLRNPCFNKNINLTSSSDGSTTLVNGREMCTVGMKGMGMASEVVKVDKRKLSERTNVDKLISIPKHSKCISGTLGRVDYSCQCEAPFVENLKEERPNCLIQVSSCDSMLCLNGICETTSNGRGGAECLCYTGYDGPRCEHRVSQWTVWSSCRPVCGRFRKRVRIRLVPNKDSTVLPSEIRQQEECPDRLGDNCPVGILSNKNETGIDLGLTVEDLFKDNDESLLQIQVAMALSGLICITIIQMLRGITFMLVK